MILTLEGIPVQQKRMKSSTRGGFSRIYDPSSKDKKRISDEIRELFEGKMLKHPIVSFIFYMPIPKSLPKKVIREFEQESTKHEKTPDVDNLVKLYLDCLTGIAFENDNCVQLGACTKVYSSKPRTVINLEESNVRFLFPTDLTVPALKFDAQSSSAKPSLPSSTNHSWLVDRRFPDSSIPDSTSPSSPE